MIPLFPDHICLCDCKLLLQSHRHEIHKSHNKAAAQWELREKALNRRLRHLGSPAPLDQASLSIIKEVCGTVINLLLLVSSLLILCLLL